MTAFKRSQAKYVRKSYETTNWPEYEAGLRQRGSLTVWLSEDEIKGWGPPKRRQRRSGGQEQYSNRTLQGQRVEARVGCKILNTMTALGMPESHQVG